MDLMFPIRTDHSGIVPSVSYSNMSKEIPKNKICWVKDCESKQNKNDWLCDKHEKLAERGKYLQMKTVGIQPFDNTPTKT